MGAAEPAFRSQIMQLEKAAGLPGADIRLMMEIVNETRGKIRELGLDPHDTTGPELYSALQTKLLRDEIQVRAGLNIRADGSPDAVVAAAQKYLSRLDFTSDTFVIKQSVARALLKKLKPQATCRRLGYRSLDSMIKHEPAALVIAAATMTEPHGWQERRLAAYKALRPSDFESRRATFVQPAGKGWTGLAAEYTTQAKHDLLAVPELGTVVLLAPQHDLPGLAITTLLLSVGMLNNMRSLSSYLKLQQVRPDYGEVFVDALLQEPISTAELAGTPLPWKTLQWFYGHGHAAYHPDVFEPHVQPADLTWHHIEDRLGALHPSLEFWEGSQLLALLDSAGHAVSLNMLDVALSTANGLDYSQRLVQHMRETLGQELLARYLHHGNLQEVLTGQLDRQLVPEFAY